MSTENALTLESLLAGLQSQEPAAIVKTASAAEPKSTSSVSERLAQALTKTASETQTTGDNSPMNNTQVGNAIARQILTKLAEEGVNAVQTQTGAMVAQQDLSSAPTPVAGSVTEVAKALLARGAANGGVSPDSLLDNAVGQADETMSQIPLMTSDGSMLESVPCDLDQEAYEDEVEKVAAVATLIDAGIDFNDAVYLVKQAEEAIAADEVEQIKIASVNALMYEGVDMASAVMATEQAIEMIKMASEEVTDADAWKATGRLVGRGYAEQLAGGVGGAGIGAALGAGIGKLRKVPVGASALIGAGLGSYTGSVAGAVHGPYKSGKNTMEAMRGAPVSTGEAASAEVRRQGRAAVEGIGGGVAGAGAGAGIGALSALVSRGRISPKDAAAIGAAIGGGVGNISGIIHGSKASTKNTMQAQRDLSKTAAALEGLVEAGHTVEDALALLGIN